MAPERTGMTVSELNLMVAEMIHRDPRTHNLVVRGEISGFKHHIASGHWYFSLKDENASVSCIMFRSHTLRAPMMPRDGDSVCVSGYLDVYARSGSYQIYVTSLRADGAGDLYLRFEELKRRLSAEGLFDPTRKRPLPMKPRRVAVVTSQSGAALHDILNVSRLRSPGIPIVLVPVAVQGSGAGAEIAAGIRKAATLPEVDVIIVGRGGGSPEDLWCFNEEAVARAVAACPIPVVSGVGHEIDTTICDLAADVRASTPSNAAEIVFPDTRELKGRVGLLRARLCQAEENQLRRWENQVVRTRERLRALSPEQRLLSLDARRLQASQRLTHAMSRRLEATDRARALAETRLQGAMDRRMNRAEVALRETGARLGAISPLAVLDRGYALVYAQDGGIITSAQAAPSRMALRFADGQVAVRREDDEANEKGGMSSGQ